MDDANPDPGTPRDPSISRRDDASVSRRDDASVSRRGFLKTTSTVAATTALAGAAHVKAQEKPAEPVSPDARRFLATGQTITLNVNGTPTPVPLTPNTTLLEALREKLNLTGAKQVCDRGACGACTVLVDGRSINSCMMLAIDAIGTKVTTVEGLSSDAKLDPVQQAFVDHDACQCGFCIPGFVVRSKAMLTENPKPTKEEIREGLCGNICRCAAYVRIFEAVESAANLDAKGGAK